MPLTKIASPQAFKSNLKAELNADKPKNQALAIAFRIQRESKAHGGSIASHMPKFGKAIPKKGFIHGTTAGRADKVPVSVKTNSYVVPADVVSSMGQGNSIAGAHSLSKVLKMGPYESQGGFADGGDVGPITDIAISDGEFNVPPEKVAELGGGNIDKGHEILDELVKHVRKKTIKTLKNLPGPKKD